MSRTAKVHGKTVTIYGPFKGSRKNGGRKHYTWYDPSTGDRGSVDEAQITWQKAHGGKEVPKGKDVDHKDGDKFHGSAKNLQVMSHSANVAKGNKERTKRKKR